MNHITLDPTNSVIFFRAPFCQEAVFQAQDHLRLLTEYYQHEYVTLKINSPGGEADCLTYLLDYIRMLRQRDIRIATEGEMIVASAAAVLLSLGETGTRQVQLGSALLFHDARVRGSAEQTLKISEAIASQLSQLTRQVVMRIVTHVETGFGGIQPLAEEGSARCALLQSQQSDLAKQLHVTSAKTATRKNAAIDAMWMKCLRDASSKPYFEMLNKRFAEDKPMDLTEAYALALIDKVTMVDVLVPDARLADPIDKHAMKVKQAA